MDFYEIALFALRKQKKKKMFYIEIPNYFT